MLVSIPFKAFIASYHLLYMRYINALKTDITYNYCFNNAKSKRYLYCVDKKENCVLISIPNFFFFPVTFSLPP